jgi:hypothetical protein
VYACDCALLQNRRTYRAVKPRLLPPGAALAEEPYHSDVSGIVDRPPTASKDPRPGSARFTITATAATAGTTAGTDSDSADTTAATGAAATAKSGSKSGSSKAKSEVVVAAFMSKDVQPGVGDAAAAATATAAIAAAAASSADSSAAKMKVPSVRLEQGDEVVADLARLTLSGQIQAHNVRVTKLKGAYNTAITFVCMLHEVVCTVNVNERRCCADYVLLQHPSV